MMYVDGRIISSFASSPIPQEDLNQFVNGPAAGGGIKESVQFLTQKTAEGKIFIATEGIYGSLPTTAMELYFLHHPGISKKGFEVTKRIPKEFVEKSHDMPVYIIFNQTQSPPSWPMDLVARYQKGMSDYYLRLYKLKQIPLTQCREYIQDDQKSIVSECE